jgi:hypothetical protein
MPNEDDNASDGSIVEILDGGSDTDICEESELVKFSRMLCDAQRKALTKEKTSGNKRKTYDGRSRTTAYRRKLFKQKLAAQGYLPIHEFMQLKSQKNAEKLTTSQDLTIEESEESSDDDVVIVSQLRDNELSVSESPNITEHTLAVSEDRCQVTPGPVASEEHRRATQGLQEEEEESTETESEGEGGGRMCEDRPDVTSGNGMYLWAALFQLQI